MHGSLSMSAAASFDDRQRGDGSPPHRMHRSSGLHETSMCPVCAARVPCPWHRRTGRPSRQGKRGRGSSFQTAATFLYTKVAPPPPWQTCRKPDRPSWFRETALDRTVGASGTGFAQCAQGVTLSRHIGEQSSPPGADDADLPRRASREPAAAGAGSTRHDRAGNMRPRCARLRYRRTASFEPGYRPQLRSGARHRLNKRRNS